MPFFYVYILQSIYHDYIYVGFTDDLRRRFHEHNSGKNLSTKAYTPYHLIFYEAYPNTQDAKRREKYFKTTKGKVTLKQMLKEHFKTRSEAMKREWQLKHWSRKKKEAVIMGDKKLLKKL